MLKIILITIIFTILVIFITLRYITKGGVSSTYKIEEAKAFKHQAILDTYLGKFEKTDITLINTACIMIFDILQNGLKINGVPTSGEQFFSNLQRLIAIKLKPRKLFNEKNLKSLRQCIDSGPATGLVAFFDVAETDLQELLEALRGTKIYENEKHARLLNFASLRKDGEFPINPLALGFFINLVVYSRGIPYPKGCSQITGMHLQNPFPCLNRAGEWMIAEKKTDKYRYLATAILNNKISEVVDDPLGVIINEVANHLFPKSAQDTPPRPSMIQH